MATRCGTSAIALAWVVLASCAGESATAAGSASYTGTLSAQNARPVATGSSATGTVVLSIDGATATYTVTASAFSTALVAGHIHIGGPTAIGPIIVPLTIRAQSGAVAAGTLDLSRPIATGTVTISGDSLRTLFRTGQTYVDLHTVAFPDGEIRGQVGP
jgi:hypothetical protein